MLDSQGPPTILDRDLCKMFYFWLSATCEKAYSIELGFNNYELSRKYLNNLLLLLICKYINYYTLKLLRMSVILYHGRNLKYVQK